MKLLLLRCPQCQSPLTPGPLDVVVGCTQCFAAVAMEEEGLHLVDVQYTAAKSSVEQWLPFWVFNGRVHLSQRHTQGGSSSAQKEAEKFWSTERRLYVPASDMEMATARQIGQRFVEDQIRLTAVPRPAEALLSAATVTASDGLKLLEFIVLSLEAERKDWLRELRFRIEAGEPELWALPAQRSGSGWKFLFS